MQPHQERVVTERAELADKTEKLGTFLFGNIFNSLVPEERTRLLKQYAFMKAYLEILTERIAAF
jgi:hypothetical protein